MWEASTEIFKTSPLFGSGFNTYKYFSSEALADIAQKNPKNYLYTLVGISNKAHQEFLQILAETGIVGFSLFIISLVLLIVYWFKIILFEKDFLKILFFLFVSSSFIIIVVHSMVSSPSHLMPNSLLAATTLGICLSKYFGNQKIEINSKFFLPLFIVLLTLLNAGLMTKYFFSEGFYSLSKYQLQYSEKYYDALKEYKTEIKKINQNLSNFDLSAEENNILSDPSTDEEIEDIKNNFPNAPDRYIESLVTNKKMNSVNNYLSDLKNKKNEYISKINEYSISQYMEYFKGSINIISSLENSKNGNNLFFAANFILNENNIDDNYKKIYTNEKELFLINANELFNGQSDYMKYTGELNNPREIIKPLLRIKNDYFSILPSIIYNTSDSTNITNTLNMINIEEFVLCQSYLDAIQYQINSQQYFQDSNSFSNIGILLFNTMSMISDLTNNLEKLKNSTNELIIKKFQNTLSNLPQDLRNEFEYTYDTAIYLRPTSNFYYKDYSENLILIYGLDGVDKLFEIGEKELYAWYYIKDHKLWIPDNVFNFLCALYSDIPDDEKQIYIVKLLNMYEDAYNWAKEKINQHESEEISLDDKDFNRLKETIKRYEELKGLKKGGTD
jgi:hypothetical protein